MNITAAVTLANLPTESDHSGSEAERYLMLLDQSKTELEALEAGMANQTPEARQLQEAVWAAQFSAQQDIVSAALAAGVDAEAIMTITWRGV
jgi:hypothetical protein